MERLTLDHPQTNMETARNLFYIKDHETWVRGGGPEPDYEDVPLYDWVRQIIKTHGLEIDVSDNDILGDCLYERLFDCVGTVEGVVAHLYTAAWAFSELREKLKVYEDKIPFDRLDEATTLVKARDVIVETAADREYIDYICPKCGDIISQRRKGQKAGVYMPKHHDSCGQRLDWTHTEAEAALSAEKGDAHEADPV